MKGILKKTEKGWMVIYDEILGKGIVKKNQNALPLHPDNEESLIEDNEIEFEIHTDERPYYLFAKIINEGVNEGVNESVKE
jgi:hypothetical protein